jgi:hypothetical protein
MKIKISNLFIFLKNNKYLTNHGIEKITIISQATQ